MILVSVDDHVVEPPRPVRGPPAGEVRRTWRRKFITKDDGTRRLGLRGPGAAEHRAQRGRRPAARGVRHRADVVRRDARRAATTSTSASTDMNANGVLGSLCFPSFPQFCGQLFARTEDKDVALAHAAGLQRLAHRRVVRHVPGPLHPAARSRRSGTRELMAAEVRRVAAKGCHAVTFSENPDEARLAELPHRPLGPVLAGVRATRAPSSACTSARRRSS